MGELILIFRPTNSSRTLDVVMNVPKYIDACFIKAEVCYVNHKNAIDVSLNWKYPKRIETINESMFAFLNVTLYTRALAKRNICISDAMTRDFLFSAWLARMRNGEAAKPSGCQTSFNNRGA